MNETRGLALETLRAAFAEAREIYLQAGVGEPFILRELLSLAPELLDGRSITACLLPGMNEFDYAALNPTVQLESFMLPAGSRGTFEAARTRIRPLAYSEIAAHLQRGPPPDLAILQVAPPDEDGLCSLGPCADFAPLVWPRARRRLGVVNPQLPRTRRGPAVPFAALDYRLEASSPFVTAETANADPVLAAIGALIARLIPDGAAIQSGIGGAPAAAVTALFDRRGLIVRSGMVTPAYQSLAEAGALDEAAEHVTGMALGPEAFTRWAADYFVFADARTTHGAAALAATPSLHTINSALEVDLFGQANLEWRGGKLFSGLGGAPDFARAARRSAGGWAILALPSCGRGAGVSRIVPRLDTPTISLPRDDADIVVTEHGVARLRGMEQNARAERMIAIADPLHRAALHAAWKQMRQRL